MQKLLLFLFILLCSFSQAQNYRLVNPDRESYFQNSNVVYGVRIDSLIQYGNDTIFKNHSIFEKYPYNGDYLNCINPKDTHFFMGRFIEKTNNDVICFNKNNDSIFLKTTVSLGNTWTVYNFSNGNKLKGFYGASLLQNILGSPDFVKIITLHVEDSFGNPVTHPMNFKQIKFSENHGLVHFYNTFEFPNDTSSFRLVGRSNPDEGISNLTKAKIFDWNIGDEFHYHGFSGGTSSGYWETYELIEILGRIDSLSNQTTTYSKRRRFYNKQVTYIPANVVISISDDTLSEQYIWSEPDFLNSLSLETYTDTSFSWNSDVYFLQQQVNSNYNGRNYKLVEPWYYVDFLSDTCYRQTIGWCIYPYVTYVEGIGFTQRLEGSPCYDNNLVYFKKGSETWGTPIDWQTLLNVDENESDFSVSVYPNPSAGLFTVATSFKTEKILISNIIGENILFFTKLNDHNNILNLSEFPKGFYLISVYDKTGKKIIRKVLIN